MPDLTYREAAKRVGRSIRTIQRWRRNGMPMPLNEEGMRVVDEDTLLAWYNARLKAWPTHRWRMRRLRAAGALDDLDGLAPMDTPTP